MTIDASEGERGDGGAFDGSVVMGKISLEVGSAKKWGRRVLSQHHGHVSLVPISCISTLFSACNTIAAGIIDQHTSNAPSDCPTKQRIDVSIDRNANSQLDTHRITDNGFHR
jgi:hypothetical protein